MFPLFLSQFQEQFLVLKNMNSESLLKRMFSDPKHLSLCFLVLAIFLSLRASSIAIWLLIAH